MSNRSAIDRVIATNLKRLRERSSLKQHELAQMAETSEMRLCACEDGRECVDKDYDDENMPVPWCSFL